ncbi:MAG: flagellar basal body P-ring formation chaperone FlgA [Planctomycetota bacterium]
MIQRAVLCIGALIALVVVGVSPAQNSVSVRDSVRVVAGAPLTVVDVAKVEGPEAASIGSIELAPDAALLLGDTRWQTVTIDEVRASIDEHAERGSWGLIRFQGKACSVGLTGPRRASVVAKAEPKPEDELPPGARVRDWVVARLARTLGVSRDDIRVTFREGDQAVLRRPVLGRPVTIVPLGASRTVPVRVRMYEPSGAIREDVVRGEIEVRRRVLRASRRIGRGSALTLADMTEETAWVAADVSSPEPIDAEGGIARRGIEAGSVIRVADIERPILIKRGELARVHCVSGSLVLECEARALTDGRLGETIEFEPTLGRQSRRPGGARFAATVRGSGRAVVEVASRGSGGKE